MEKTTSIKFFWNGVKVNGDKKLIRCHYSLDNYHDGHEGVTIYARDYSGHLPGDLFPVRNETDTYTDYFETDRAELEPGHPLYNYARAAAIKAELRNEKHCRAETCDAVRQPHLQRLWKYKQELLALPTGQPTAADVEAVHALNLAAETARIQAEKEAEQKEREEVLRQRNEGLAYIESIAAAHPIQEGAPVVTIEWSECPAFYSWEDGELKLSVAAADIVLRHYDKAPDDGFCYYKTKFTVNYTINDAEKSHTDRYDLGDNDGGLINHIRRYNSALADCLERYTECGHVVSVTAAPWLEEAVKARKEAAQQRAKNTLEMVDMLTDEQLTAAVLRSPKDQPDIARFFLQALARRDEDKAISAYKAWQSGAGLEALDEI